MSAFLLVAALATVDTVVLENDYVRVVRGGAPCAAAGAGCDERVIVALGPVAMESRTMVRGDVAVFEAGKAFTPPSSGDYVEVAFKSGRPATESPEELIAPDKNSILYDGDRLFVFEEKLEPGDTRPRHSHSQRVVIVLNDTRLQQWPDGSPEVFKDQVPDTIKFNEPVIHVVKNVGKAPLRNIVLELKPED